MSCGKDEQARKITVQMLHDKVPQTRTAGLLHRKAEPARQKLVKIPLRAYLKPLYAVFRWYDGAERHAAANQLPGNGRCNGDSRIQLLLCLRSGQMAAAEIRQQRDIVMRRVARLTDDQLIRLAGQLPVNGSYIITRDIIADIEHFACIAALAVLHDTVIALDSSVETRTWCG